MKTVFYWGDISCSTSAGLWMLSLKDIDLANHSCFSGMLTTHTKKNKFIPDVALQHTMWNNFNGSPKNVINMELKVYVRTTKQPGSEQQRYEGLLSTSC